jgi:hypothetical protein
MSGNPIASLWNRIREWANQNAKQFLYVPIPKGRTDAEYDEAPLQEFRSYFRIWLCDMYLTQSRKWFVDWFPAVSTSVQLKFNDQNGVTFTAITQAPQDQLARGPKKNYHMTELLPFNGGIMEIEAALLALPGKNHLNAVIGLLQDFSGLIAPPFGQVLTIAEKVSSGMQNILNATQGQVHIGFHQELVSSGGGGKNDLRPGYIAVILATEDNVKSARLSVKDDRLYYSSKEGAQPQPLTGYDYMLFRIEGREDRDDWRLSNIEEPLNKAIEAIINEETEKADAYRKVALATALTSPDLAVFDRRRVAQAIKDELTSVEALGKGAQISAERDLKEIVQTRAIDMETSASRGEMSFEELFG